jgi:hypothetical protein
MNAALFLFLVVPADVPRIPTAVDRSLDLATLTHRQAQQLDGRRVRVRVELEFLPGDAGGPIVYDCVSPDDANRTVWLVPGQVAKDSMDVEGVFRLPWRQPGNGSRGTGSIGLTGLCGGRGKLPASSVPWQNRP